MGAVQSPGCLVGLKTRDLRKMTFDMSLFLFLLCLLFYLFIFIMIQRQQRLYLWE